MTTLAPVDHVHLNIRQDMPLEKIRADVAAAFSSSPDTIVFNECTTVTHKAIRSQAREHGYGVYAPRGAASQVVIAWKKSRFSLLLKRARLAGPGLRNVTPNRYVVRVRLQDRATGKRVVVVGTHMISSGWTGAKHLDAFRRAHWHAHMGVMRRVMRRAVEANDLVIWSGDLNRPAWSFKGRPLPSLRFAGTCSVVAETGPTHGGARFDYAGAVSRICRVTATARTFDAHSDHRGIRVRYTLKETS